MKDVTTADKSQLEEQSTNKSSIKWGDVESAFKNRIKSAVITNCKHLDYDAFMDDVQILFK